MDSTEGPRTLWKAETVLRSGGTVAAMEENLSATNIAAPEAVGCLSSASARTDLMRSPVALRPA